MQVKSIAECSKSILPYFRPSLNYQLSLRYFLSIFEWSLKTGFTVFIFRDGWVRIGLCIPRDAIFHFHQMGGIHTILNTKKWNMVDSLEELDEEDGLMGTKLYYNRTVG